MTGIDGLSKILNAGGTRQLVRSEHLSIDEERSAVAEDRRIVIRCRIDRVRRERKLLEKFLVPSP